MAGRVLTGPHVTAMGVDFARAPGDGSCFFHAVGAQVGLSANQVRARFANHYDGIAGDPARAAEFIRVRGQGIGNVAAVVRNWQTHILGYQAPTQDAPTAQQAVKSYADSIRAGAWGGEIEQAVIPIVFPGYTVRVYRRNGNDVEHSYTNGPGFVEGDWYRRCFPDAANGRCINLLAAGARGGRSAGHYDWLRRSQAAINAPAPAAPAPAAAAAPPARMSRKEQEEANYQRAIQASLAEQPRENNNSTMAQAMARSVRDAKEQEFRRQLAGKKNVNSIVQTRLGKWDKDRPERQLEAVKAAIKAHFKQAQHKYNSYTGQLVDFNSLSADKQKELLKKLAKEMGVSELYLVNIYNQTGGGKTLRRRKIQRQGKGKKTTRRHKRS